jgi:glucosamine-6-phosphate deaminase
MTAMVPYAVLQDRLITEKPPKERRGDVMELIIQKDKDRAARLTALLIAKEVRRNPHAVLGLATGRTMEIVYDKLAEEHKKSGLDFSLCRSFNLDEYVGLPRSNPNSYFSYMNQHLFSRINIDPRNTHLPNGEAEDIERECLKYEEHIARCGGIDLQLLGIGRDGHIGFNEPLSSLNSQTRPKCLTPETFAQNSPLFTDGTAMPLRAITMGVGTILRSKATLMLVTGAEKADVLVKAVEGPVSSMVTASALQYHPRCTVIVDEEAAAKLQGKEYYRWIFEKEPKWQEFHNL